MTTKKIQKNKESLKTATFEAFECPSCHKHFNHAFYTHNSPGYGIMLWGICKHGIKKWGLASIDYSLESEQYFCPFCLQPVNVKKLKPKTVEGQFITEFPTDKEVERRIKKSLASKKGKPNKR